MKKQVKIVNAKEQDAEALDMFGRFLEEDACIHDFKGHVACAKKWSAELEQIGYEYSCGALVNTARGICEQKIVAVVKKTRNHAI